MSDLQISLLAIGVVVIAGVYLFNFVVERGYRRRAEASFKSAHSDVLLEVPVASRAAPERVEPRIEPYMEMQPAPVVDAVEEWPEIQPEPEVEPEPEVKSCCSCTRWLATTTTKSSGPSPTKRVFRWFASPERRRRGMKGCRC